MKPESISNIFRRSGFTRQIMDIDDVITDETFELGDMIDHSTFVEFCDCDGDEQCSASLTDVEICENIVNQHADSDLEKELLVTEDVDVSAKDALKALGP